MPKNKTLPKDFEEHLKSGDLVKLKAVFDKCALDALGGVFKQTALAFAECPDQLAAWLVSQGLSVEAPNSRGETPLQSRSGHWQGRIKGLIDLGADVNLNNGQGTALHSAAGAHHADNVKILLEHGARVEVLDKNSMTPLELALQRCSNATLVRMAQVADLLLAAGAVKTPRMKDFVTRVGGSFEFQRANFNPETVQETSDALDHLYKLFDAAPVARRQMHDGVSPIIAKSAKWEDRHQELWEMLIPGSGAAKTVQGEVIRISGKIAHELDGNGGVNWDAEFKQMADAWLAHVGSGTPLSPVQVNEAASLVKEIKGRGGEPRRMCELSVDWVALNPQPVALGKPIYAR